MNHRQCIFCKFSTDSSEKHWENDLFYMMYDSFPVSPGHALIIPKRHVVDIEGLDKKEWILLQSTIKLTINEISKTNLKLLYQNMVDNPMSDLSVWFCKKALKSPRLNTKPDAYNHGLNDGKEAGRTVDHLHWHVIPRYEGDMEDPRGGVRYVVPEMGNYKVERK